MNGEKISRQPLFLILVLFLVLSEKERHGVEDEYEDECENNPPKPALCSCHSGLTSFILVPLVTEWFLPDSV
jgi:hypothetical protein